MTQRVMTIDFTDETAVVVCSCGWRAPVSFSPKTAYKYALEHVHMVHPNNPLWQRSIYSWRYRHADLFSE